MDYFESTPPGLAVSRCPLTLRRKKLYTQRRRGQCHIRKSSWRLPISIPLPTCRETKSKTKQGGIAHHGRFPPYLKKKRTTLGRFLHRTHKIILDTTYNTFPNWDVMSIVKSNQIIICLAFVERSNLKSVILRKFIQMFIFNPYYIRVIIELKQ